LIVLTLIATLNSIIFGLSDIASNLDAARRGRKYYINQLDPHWKNKNGTVENFISANDVQDLSTLFHFVFGASMVFINYGVSMWYAWKTLRVVQIPLGTHAMSRNTRSLTKQFTRNLFIQSVVTQLCAVLPSSYIAFYLVFKPNFLIDGPLTSSMLAWNPAANALVTICVVRPYRAYVMQLLGLNWLSRRVSSVHSSSSSAALAANQKNNSMGTTSNRYTYDTSTAANRTEVSPNLPRVSFAMTDSL
jgi:hypothetical protein